MFSETVSRFWSEFCQRRDVDVATPYQVWYFGNSAEMALELADLVIAGVKTATASLAKTNEVEPENAPVDDGYSVVTDFAGEPLCIIQTAEIRHLPFCQVNADFAFDEGEGDRTLEYWRRVHHDYFTREASKLGFDFDENSIVCCERFKLLFTK